MINAKKEVKRYDSRSVLFKRQKRVFFVEGLDFFKSYELCEECVKEITELIEKVED